MTTDRCDCCHCCAAEPVIALRCVTREGPPRRVPQVATAVAVATILAIGLYPLILLKAMAALIPSPSIPACHRSSSWYRMAASTASRHVARAGAGFRERRAGIDDTPNGYRVGARLGT
jgi:hypothetical protein